MMSEEGNKDLERAEGSDDTLQPVQMLETEQRIRTLTPPAEEIFEQKCKFYYEKINTYLKTIDDILSSEEINKKQKEELLSIFEKYDEQFNIFSHYLTRTRSEKSMQEVVTLQIVHDKYSYQVHKVSAEEKIDNHSVRSSRVSTHSGASINSKFSEKKAKLEALKASQQLFDREKDLQIQKAKVEEEQMYMKAEIDRKKLYLDIELERLSKEKELLQVESELKVIQEESKSQKGEVENVDIIRTKVSMLPQQSKKEDKVTMDTHKDKTTAKAKIDTHKIETSHVIKPNKETDLSKLFLKKELLMQRLRKFDDKPEHYQVWKNSFQGISKELDLTPSEEFDLLMKYLGSESVKYAERIQAANARNPEQGLEKLWKRMYERYGLPELIEKALKEKLDNFTGITAKNTEKLFELADLLDEISSYMADPKYSALLGYFNSSAGVLPIVGKLPYFLQTKWTNHASKYKKDHDVAFPPFSVFVDFVKDASSMMNDPGLVVRPDNIRSERARQPVNNMRQNFKAHGSTQFNVRKTDIGEMSNLYCPYHNTNGHSLNKCRTFKKMSLNQRKQFLKENRICFNCCDSNTHVFKNCGIVRLCDDCGSQSHMSAMHISRDNNNLPQQNEHQKSENSSNPNIASKCTQVCGKGFIGRSCSKTVLAKISSKNKPDHSCLCYVIIDDQSNKTLCHSDLFSKLNTNVQSSHTYTMSTCSGDVQVQGRQLSDLVLTSLDGDTIHLPSVTECEFLPNVISEVATPEVTENFEHLRDVKLPPLCKEAAVLLLVGRDVPEAHHILEQRTGPQGTPFAQRLRLGWTVIGQVCLDGLHLPMKVTTMKTNILQSGRPTLLEECENHVIVKDIFMKTSQDEKIGLSVEDKEFLSVMNTEFTKDDDGHWSAPLPFRMNRPELPGNKTQALHRAQLLHASMKKNPTKRGDMMKFMEDILESYAEEAPPLHENEEYWYLPIFGIYHPQKKDQLRAVFDSSAKFKGVSLNSVLLSGPDLINNLVGVLLRFRLGSIGITGDIQKMFYQFRVSEKHRNYLRFLWYRDNDFSKELIDFRMKVHVFGNSPSPAVAIYGLQKTAEESMDEEVRDCINNNFYVDDGLLACDTINSAVSVMSKTKEALDKHGKLRLHKFASNSPDVLKAFEQRDLSINLQDLDFENGVPAIQRSLGLYWNMSSDKFTFMCQNADKPATRRGVLATVNGLYDPLGFAAPVVLQGKLIFRDTNDLGWDAPLPENLDKEWRAWNSSLENLNQVEVQRHFTKSCNRDSEKRLYIYADASQNAISAVAYMKDIQDGSFGFVMGKAKVAPKHGHTIPRLELCAAQLAVQLGQTLSCELGVPLKTICYFTDSKVVLGYLNNRTRRFYIYVENRVSKILDISSSSQWSYVPTNLNPADDGSRGLSPDRLQNSMWLCGPKCVPETGLYATFSLVDPNDDIEIRPEINVYKTEVQEPIFDITWFERFSSLKKMLTVIALLQHIAISFKKKLDNCAKWHICEESKSVESLRNAELFLIKTVQSQVYAKEINCLEKGKPISKDSSVIELNPVLDQDGLLRVGGRLKRAGLTSKMKHPVLIPGKHHLAKLIVSQCHESVKHQGRHFTEGAIRDSGYWITGMKRLVSSFIHSCVKCRRLRAAVGQQKMADLPEERLMQAPPFTFIGIDVFGPWEITTRKSRGGSVNSKRWAVLFTCLVTRSIHIEVIEEMTSSSFINALRRFSAIRGRPQAIFSDQGTNFIGAARELGLKVIAQDERVIDYLTENSTVWKFNPPHASHFGGVWERMIGITRRILDSLLMNCKTLTHEILCTFLAEAMAIINARPLVPISSDPETTVLSPTMLLTQKTQCDTFSFDHLSVKDAYKSLWKQVQYLATKFWTRWRQEYVHTLQSRRKWTQETSNIREGDVVLMKDASRHRNDWPLGLITRVYPSEDNLVRKCEVRVMRDNKPQVFDRPISEIIVLCEADVN